jgi:arylsulfatase A-like enzyme
MKRMNRRHFLAGACSTLALAATERPNVVVILTDDQGYGDLGCHGNPVLKTPNLDRFHRESTRFTNFYSSPLCSPTRSSLMTGRYSYRTGIVDTWVGLAQMRSSEVTLAEILKSAGYRTGLFGKWHLGDCYPMRAMDQGFEESLTFTDGLIGALGDPAPNTYWDPTLLRNGKSENTKGYCTDIFFSEATRYLQHSDRRPAFVYIPTNVPHGPLQIAEQYAEKYRKAGVDDPTAKLYGMVENLDENIGRFLQFLSTSGLDQKTIVIFMSDNGGWGVRYSAGLRDQKGSVYEGGIRVPFFVRAPGRLRAAVDIDRIAAHIDVLPTLLDLCGVKLPPKLQLDGRSLAPLMRDPSAAWQPRTLFFQQSRPDPNGIDEPRLFTHCAARSQQYKIVMTAPDPKQTYTKAIAAGETELYDIIRDPGEKSNIAAQHPHIVADMRRDYESWFRDVTAGLNVPVRIHVGAKSANPVTLTPQDLHGPRASASPWNYDRAKAYWKNEPDGYGYWELEVSRTGRYEVVTRLGTQETPYALRAGNASLTFGDWKEEKAIAAGAAQIRFSSHVKRGPARLEIGFSGQRKDGQLISPFFVDVTYLGN